MEFCANTGNCFISDKALAENFGVSESTIKREIKKLEEMGLITRETKAVKGGKERHMRVDL
jgi:predicted transcriptional regulator